MDLSVENLFIGNIGGVKEAGREPSLALSLKIKGLFVRAASLRGQKLSEFMLESARQQAGETLLDQRNFFLDAEAHASFLKLLDEPPAPSAEVSALLSRKAPWEK
jgi:uncharacterized protein (DUF1778 family)